MPIATVSLVPVRKDLKTCPEGWVDLRRAPFGEKLRRSDNAIDTTMRASKEMQEKGDAEMFMRVANARVTEMQFAACIVDHNLETADGRKLNFKNVEDVRALDPRIGEEIAGYIDEINNYEEEQDNSDPGNSPTASKEI